MIYSPFKVNTDVLHYSFLYANRYKYEYHYINDIF